MFSASLACLQQLYVDGLFHPTVTSSMASPLYQNNFSTSAILQQPASIKANLTCTCGQFYDNPCRMEMRTVRDRVSGESSAFRSAKLYFLSFSHCITLGLPTSSDWMRLCSMLPDTGVKH